MRIFKMVQSPVNVIPAFISLCPAETVDGPVCGNTSTSTYPGGIQKKKSTVCPVESLACALQEQLASDRDSDSLTTSPSSSSLDTCGSQRVFQLFSKPSMSQMHQGTSGVGAGETRPAGETSGSSPSEADGGNSADLKIARSMTEGELRHQMLNPLSHHGVGTAQLNLVVLVELLCNRTIH